MEKMLLLGDEAVGQAAIDSGLGGAFGYPGTPSTEIFEYLQRYSEKHGGFSARWSGNEKVALEEALGMSYIGRRAIVTMKSVGLNVAADPFVCSGITGVNGGLVVAVADDPGMHSSQNEQDARYYADFAKIPCFESADQQECYDMAKQSFQISEAYKIPVLLRLVTRIAHSRAPVSVELKKIPKQDIHLPEDSHSWILLPSHSRREYPRLLEKNKKLSAFASNCRWNSIVRAKSSAFKSKGIICCGTAYNYAMEAMSVLGADADVLKIGFYPLPVELIRGFVASKKEVLVLEDSYPYLEERLLGIVGSGPKISGRLDGAIGPTGELNPDNVQDTVAVFLGATAPQKHNYDVQVPQRPPMLCQGCSHADTYKALKEALASRKPSAVFSDIGCYTLGALKPYEAINTCVEMGASVGMAKGAAEGGLPYPVAVIGDSTFQHSGLTSLLGAAVADSPMTLIILDNSTTAMTGAQDSLVNGNKLVALVKGTGVNEKHIRLLNPLPKNHAENVAIISEELEHRGLSVIIAQRECIQILGKKKPGAAK